MYTQTIYRFFISFLAFVSILSTTSSFIFMLPNHHHYHHNFCHYFYYFLIRLNHLSLVIYIRGNIINYTIFIKFSTMNLTFQNIHNGNYDHKSIFPHQIQEDLDRIHHHNDHIYFSREDVLCDIQKEAILYLLFYLRCTVYVYILLIFFYHFKYIYYIYLIIIFF